MDYQNYLDGTQKVLEQSRKELVPYSVFVLGKEFIVYPRVFSPKYFKDTELFAEHLPVKEGEDMLEIGPGTGIVSINAIWKGAKHVIAIDINPEAVKNTQENIHKHDLEKDIEVRQGNVYEPLKVEEKFDTIFWNTPFGLIGTEPNSMLERAVYDQNYEATHRFITEARGHLKENGRVLIGFSSTLGKLDELKKIVLEAGMTMRLIYEVESEETHPVKFEIFEAR